MIPEDTDWSVVSGQPRDTELPEVWRYRLGGVGQCYRRAVYLSSPPTLAPLRGGGGAARLSRLLARLLPHWLGSAGSAASAGGGTIGIGDLVTAVLVRRPSARHHAHASAVVGGQLDDCGWLPAGRAASARWTGGDAAVIRVSAGRATAEMQQEERAVPGRLDVSTATPEEQLKQAAGPVRRVASAASLQVRTACSPPGTGAGCLFSPSPAQTPGISPFPDATDAGDLIWEAGQGRAMGGASASQLGNPATLLEGQGVGFGK